MTPEDVNKSIKQMRQVFIAAGVINLIILCLLVVAGLSDSNNSIASILFLAPLALAEIACLWIAAYGLEKHTSTGYTFALISSVLFIISFPVYTIFGIIYLNKLLKTEMKQVFGKPNRFIIGIALGIIVLVCGCPILLVLIMKGIDSAGLWCNLVPFMAGCN
jgi:hypothetical protein